MSDYDKIAQEIREYGELIRETSAIMAEAMKELAEAGEGR